MKTASEPTLTISPDDFRRLGVRPDETRIAVIRLAATRSSKPLAAQHLRRADTKIELQLSQVATSAYRLMDPRQRADDGSRSRVGRILPLTLRSAGANQGGGFCHAELGSEPAFHQDQQSTIEWAAAAGFEESQVLFDLKQRWESTVVSDPRLALPAQAESRYLKVLAACATALVLIAWVIDQSRNSDGGNQLLVDSGNVIVPQEYEQFISGLPSLEFAMRSAVDGVHQTNREGLSVPWITDLAPIAPMRWVAEHADAADELSEVNGFQRPTREEVVRTRRLFQTRFPELNQSASPDQVNRQIRLLQTVSQQIEPGSIDDWTCQLFMAELSWLVNDPIFVRRRLKQTADRYGVSVDSLMAESFEAACGLATLPETQQQLLEDGLPIADRLLIRESFAASRQVIAALIPVEKSLGQDQSSLQLPQFVVAIDQAERLSKVAARVQDGGLRPVVGEGQNARSESEAAVLGRYYCLYLRRWDLGLPWLTKAADLRLASAARHQLALGVSAKNAEIAEVASLWFALADRAEGRIADSIRLHGLEMLESMLKRSSGIRKRRLQQAIEEQSSLLPAYLQRSLVTG
ncbi:MAG: hypothetical protein P8L85_09575 [Rubripirellula sp.]|nr:hypothetical protein [Rubripirellula sp.]